VPLRSAILSDLRIVASWITSARDCELWAGWRVKFPIDLESLPEALGFAETNAFSLVDADRLVAFGQLVRKDPKRGHLGRLIVCPADRGVGYGEALVRSLLDLARAERYECVALYVDALNVPAIALYSKVGFRNVALPEDRPKLAGSRYMEMQI
jgi:ribosomal protein S18 acetylase RimI-like enzyme